MSPEAAMHALKAYAALDSVVIVGHQPDLSFFLDKVLVGFPHVVKKGEYLDLSKLWWRHRARRSQKLLNKEWVTSLPSSRWFAPFS